MCYKCEYNHMSAQRVLSIFQLEIFIKKPKWLRLMQVYARLCACECVCTFVLNQTTNSLSGWALCFDFFSFSLRSNASPISYAARTSLEGLQSLSPSTYESVPPSPFLSSLLFLLQPIFSWLPVLIYWATNLYPNHQKMCYIVYFLYSIVQFVNAKFLNAVFTQVQDNQIT